jgi:hypothetical protein
MKALNRGDADGWNQENLCGWRRTDKHLGLWDKKARPPPIVTDSLEIPERQRIVVITGPFSSIQTLIETELGLLATSYLTTTVKLIPDNLQSDNKGESQSPKTIACCKIVPAE